MNYYVEVKAVRMAMTYRHRMWAMTGYVPRVVGWLLAWKCEH